MKPHEHNFIPYKIEREPNQFSKIGYYYSKCDCGTLAGSPIKDEKELKELYEQLGK